MPRSRITVLSWIVAGSFFLATALQYVDQLNLVATPPAGLDDANMVDRILGSSGYRQAIWPVFLWTNLLFAVGFAAGVAFAATIASASGVPGGLPTFVALVTTGGIIGAIASIIPLGAVNAAVWLGYCDCGFKETEIVSQAWAQMVALDIGDWFNRFASVVLAIGLVILVRDAGARLSSLLRTWTYVTAAVLAAVPLLGFVDRFDMIPQLLSTALGFVLIPVWAILLGRAFDRGPEPAGA